jgi:hypothetical protein
MFYLDETGTDPEMHLRHQRAEKSGSATRLGPTSLLACIDPGLLRAAAAASNDERRKNIACLDPRQATIVLPRSSAQGTVNRRGQRMDRGRPPARASFNRPQDKPVEIARRLRIDRAHAPVPRPIWLFSTPDTRGSN